MGEYVYYSGKLVKIGTLAVSNVSYSKYSKALSLGLLSPYACSPVDYAMPDEGFIFRFPFPDEDHLPFGDIGGFSQERTVELTIGDVGADVTGESKPFTIHIRGQKPVAAHHAGKFILALIVCYRGEYGLHRIEDRSAIARIVKEIRRQFLVGMPESEQYKFWQQMAERIMSGYR